MVTENRPDTKELLRCPLFAELDGAEAEAAAGKLNAAKAVYRRGDVLHRPYTRLTRFGTVLSGRVQACADGYDGSRMILAEVAPGHSFGESLCYLHTEDAAVYIRAAEPSEVLWLSAGPLSEPEPDDLLRRLQLRFTALLAARTLSMNRRIQILSGRTLREKILRFLSDCEKVPGERFTVPAGREDMADYLGADRASLSRELSRMKHDGLIDFEKNSFRLIR